MDHCFGNEGGKVNRDEAEERGQERPPEAGEVVEVPVPVRGDQARVEEGPTVVEEVGPQVVRHPVEGQNSAGAEGQGGSGTTRPSR